MTPAGSEVASSEVAGSEAASSEAASSEAAVVAAPKVGGGEDSVVSFLSYNVWFRESVALEERMQAIVDVVEAERPTVVALQEVTRKILGLIEVPLRNLGYDVRVRQRRGGYFVALGSRVPWDWVEEESFGGLTVMGRGLLYGQIAVQDASGCSHKLVVGTAHLESPVPPYKDEALMVLPRRAQLEAALQSLGSAHSGPSVLLGDLNWNEGPETDPLDGPMPLPPAWRDAWTMLHRDAGTDSFVDSLTFDAVANPMLDGELQYRPDRVLSRGLEVVAARLVGREPLPGVTATIKGHRRPVLPSDHFGLLVRASISSSSSEAQACV